MREYALLFVVVVLFSGNIIVGKAAATSLPPFTLACARAGIAFLAALVFFGRSAGQQKAVLWQWRRQLFFIGITGIALFNALIYTALHTANTTDVAVLETAIPVVTALAMRLFFRERLGWLQWAGVIVSVVGAGIVVSRGAPWHLFASASIGDGVMLGAVAAWVVYSLTARSWLPHLPAYASMVPLSGFAVLFLLPFALVENIFFSLPRDVSVKALAAVLYLGLGPSFVAFIIYNRAVVSIGPTAAAVCLNFLPVVTIAGSWLFLGSQVLIVQLLGGLAVIVGVTLVLVRRRRPGSEVQD